MSDKVTTILKILLLSSLISFIVKYGGRLLPVSPSLFNVMIAVFLPSMIMGGWLVWRWKN